MLQSPNILSAHSKEAETPELISERGGNRARLSQGECFFQGDIIALHETARDL